MKKFIYLFALLSVTFNSYSQNLLVNGYCRGIEKDGNNYYTFIDSIGLFESEDGLKSFKLKSNFSFKEGGQVLGFVCLPLKILILTNDSGVFIFDKKNKKWRKSNIGIAKEDLQIWRIKKFKNKIFLCSEHGLYESTNEGESWSKNSALKVPNDTTDTKINKQLEVLDFKNNFMIGIQSLENELYVGSSAGKIYLSKDVGNTWNQIYDFPGVIYEFSIAEINNSRYLKGTWSSLLKQEKGTNIWSVIPSPQNVNEFGFMIKNIDNSLYTLLKIKRNIGEVYSFDEIENIFSKINLGVDGVVNNIEKIDGRIFISTSKGLYIK